MATNIENALKIPGFMQPPELTWLAEQAQTRKRIVEVGSLLGRSTCALADNTSGFVLAVDDFKGPRDCAMTWKDRQTVFEKFSKNLETQIASGKVIPWKVDHAKLTEEIYPFDAMPSGTGFKVGERITFDMVFIDGDHKYESVKRDIAFWKKWMVPGGLFCGHDYELAYPGIIQSTFEAFGTGPGVVPFTSIWWVEIPSQESAVA